MNKKQTSQKLYLIGLLLYAVEPVIEYNDVFFYFSCIFAVLCLLLGAALELQDYLKDKENWWKDMMNSSPFAPETYLVIAVGLVACYASGATRMAYSWWLLLSMCVCSSLPSLFKKR